MRLLILLATGYLLVISTAAAKAARPTVTVIIPGWSPGDGRQIWPSSLRDLGEQAGQTMAGGGSNNKTIYYKWPSHGNNEQAVADLARQIKAEAAEMGTEVDLQIIGHSRGGIVACDVLEQIGNDPQFGYVQGVLLDPTAAITAGDRFPAKKPAGVDRLVNYYDGKNGILIGGAVPSDYPGWRNTRSDRDIAGAENHEVDLGSGDTHVSIVESYRDNEIPVNGTDTGAESDSQTFYKNKEGVGHVPQNGGGTNQKIVMQSPKTDQERLSGPIEKGLNDAFEQGGKAGSDSAREWHNVLEGKLGSTNSNETGTHWDKMADQGWMHGREMASGGAEQLKRNLQNGGKQVKELAGRGAERLKENAGDFVKDPAGTIERGLAHNGRELERLGNHYADGAVQLGKHELNMGAAGVQHAGRMLDKQGERAGDSIAQFGESMSRAWQNPGPYNQNQREVLRPLGDIVREGSRALGDGVRETTRLGGDVLRESSQAAQDVTREGGQAARDLSQTTSRAAKDTLVAGGKAVGNTGRELKRTTSAAGKRVRVFADDAARESNQAGGNFAREAKALPQNLQQIAEHPDRALAAGRENAERVFANTEQRTGRALSQARDKALSDAADATQRAGQSLTRTRDRVRTDLANNSERAGEALTRTRDRVQAQGAAFDKHAGETLTQARDRAYDHLADAEQNVGSALSQTRDRVVAATHSTQQQAGEAWNDGRQQLGDAWNNLGEQLPRQQPWQPNPLADFGRNVAEALQREQARQQAQRAQELARQQAQRAQEAARQQAIAAQQAAQRQAAALQRQAEERARQAAMARDHVRRQAEQARQRMAEQARRAEAEARAAAQRAANDVKRETGNLGGAISSGWKKVSGGFGF